MAGIFDVNEFKQATGDFHYQNRFYVRFKNGFGEDLSEIKFLIRNCEMPGKEFGLVETTYMGVKVKTAGSITYPDWTCTFIGTKKNTASKFIEAWQQQIRNTATNTPSIPSEYKIDVDIIKVGNSGEEIVEIRTLKGAFPYTRDSETLDHEAVDTVSELPVTFAYDTWEDTTSQG